MAGFGAPNDKLGELAIRAAGDLVHVFDCHPQAAAEGLRGDSDHMLLFRAGERPGHDQPETDVIARGLHDLVLENRPDLHHGPVAVVGRTEVTRRQHEQVAGPAGNGIQDR